uniref:leucine-rich repeat domain-containing protein n=1 Tax=uncultured Prevotella sp. TaxID=159272 RepID=UPI00258A1EFE
MNRQLFARAWMLLLTAVIAIPLSAQQLTVQVDNEGGLWDALEAQGVTNFAGIKNLKVTGVLGSADFQLIKNQMSNIESIDISGTSVTEIPNRTFSNKSNLKLVRLPEDVTIIRYDAFNSCEILESVTFGNQSVTAGKIKFPVTLRYIEYSAFLSCKLLTHIDFSACTNLEYIGSSAFENLPNLKELLLPSIGNIRFDWNCFNIGQIWDETSQQWIYKGLEELTLTKAITSMDGYCLPRSLKTLFVESSTPPSCNNEVFSPFLENGTTSLKIYIPKGSKRNYAIADGWSKIYQYMEEMGIKLNISGYGTLQKDNNTYSDGDVFFTTQGSSTTLKAEPEIGCELISVKLDGNDLTVATDGTISIPVGTTVGTLDVTFTANPITIDNPNGGELKNKIIALGITPGTLRTLKITGKLNAKDWNFVTNSLSSLEVFDISETNVTSIPESVLRERQFLTTVHLPSTVTVINRYAFYNCQQLTTVDGCENVEEIRERGFAYCAKLADFPFGNKIRSIESGVFENCASLPEALIMPSSLTTLGWDNVFNGSSIRTFDLSQCTLTSNIGNNAFGECTSLTLPEKGDYCLSCSALSNAHLTELRIPAAVRNLDCDNILPQMLERLYVSRTVPIDANSSALNNIDFGVCTLYVPTGSIEAYSEANGWQNFVDIKEYGIKVIINGFGSLQQGYRTFANGEALFTQSNASMLKAVPEMGNEIVSVTLDDNTLAIGNDGTFTIPTENDLGTLHITFTANPITIDNPNGSELKTKITGFNIEPSAIHALKVTGKLTSKDWNFVSSSLQMIELFDISETNITSIPESALRERQYLTTVHLPSTVTNIGSYAFYNCQQLTTVDGCDNVEEIGDRAFSNCTQLANFPFGNKLRSLSSGVFENCSSLPETLVMPASLNYMWYDNIFNGSSVRSFDLSQCTLNQSLQHNLFGKCTSLLLPENGNYQLNEYALSEALLTELRLPAAVSGINCDQVLPATLQRLYVTHTEPIYVSDNNAFTNIDYKLCTLYVPVGTKAAYSETNGWSEFTIIKECGFIIRTDSLGILKYEGKDYHDGDAFIPSQEGSITMQIIPSFGYEIATLKIDGIALDYADDGTFTIPSTIIGGRIEVTFAKKQLEIAVTMEGNGSYTIDGQSYTSSSTLITNGGDVLKLHLQPATGNFVKHLQKGESLTLNIAPTGDYNFQSILVNDADVTEGVIDGNFTLNNITTNTTIHAIFSSPNVMIVDNTNGGELRTKITEAGGNPATIRSLKVVGKMTNKDWNLVMSNMPVIEEFNISETDVKVIPESAFSNKDRLTTVHLPSTVVTINNSAFSSCYQLTTIDGCENVQEIGNS